MKMIKQRLIGFVLVLIAVLVVVMASTGGPSPEDQDATTAVLIAPLGLWMMFTKSYVLYDGEPVETQEPKEEPDPWAPSSPTAILPHPLYPFESPFYEQLYREEKTPCQEKESSKPRKSRAGRA